MKMTRIWEDNRRKIRWNLIWSSILILIWIQIMIQLLCLPPSPPHPPPFLIANHNWSGCQHLLPGPSSGFCHYQYRLLIHLHIPLCHIVGVVIFTIAIPRIGFIQRTPPPTPTSPLFMWIDPPPPTHLFLPRLSHTVPETIAPPQSHRVFISTVNGGRGQGGWSQEEKAKPWEKTVNSISVYLAASVMAFLSWNPNGMFGSKKDNPVAATDSGEIKLVVTVVVSPACEAPPYNGPLPTLLYLCKCFYIN